MIMRFEFIGFRNRIYSIEHSTTEYKEYEYYN